jgi:lysophospholipase L1-like esterase
MANLPDLTLLPFYAHKSTTQKTQARQEIQHWNTQIAVLAQKYNISLVDLYKSNSQITAHPDYISKDGFHPSTTGYAQLADDFWAAIDNPNT